MPPSGTGQQPGHPIPGATTWEDACPTEITFYLRLRAGGGLRAFTVAFDPTRSRASYLAEIAAVYPGSQALSFDVSGRDPGQALPPDSFVRA